MAFGPGSKNRQGRGKGAGGLSPHPSAARSHRALGLFQVSRNFELVGRVNLDQLEQMKGKLESSSSEDEDKEEDVGKAEDRGESRPPAGPRWQSACLWGAVGITEGAIP